MLLILIKPKNNLITQCGHRRDFLKNEGKIKMNQVDELHRVLS